jgi:hypothetical protein
MTLYVAFAVLAVVVGLCVSVFRNPNKVKTTRAGAELALNHLQEWSKWMSGIQTAALGGLGLMTFDCKSGSLLQADDAARGFAVAAAVLLGAALFCSAWVLSALPSLAIRIYAETEKEPSAKFDVYEMPLFGWLKEYVHVGYLLTAQHWLWGLGLLALGGFLLSIHSR